ncbi:MAG: CvpA family protein [Sedimentisphaerales bacterium]|nr:CvpA family protein [Sedimentisphaerales bacterium]
MIAILILFVIFAGLVYFQVFTQGIFSCFIMMVWTIIAALVALNYQDYLAMLMIDNGFAFFPRAVALMVPFILVLFILREITDRFVSGNMKFNDIIDRMGSTVFSVVSSLIIVGMISICLQSLPLGTKLLGFERVEDMARIEQQRTFWPAGDAFVVKSMEMASANCFAGNMKFGQFHPDYLRSLHMNKVVPSGHEGSYQYAPSGSIVIKEVKIRNTSVPLVTVIPASYNTPEQRKAAGKLEKGEGDMISVVIDINIRASANEAVSCKDVDGNIRFALSQFRLFGFAPGKEAIECYPATVMNRGGISGEALTLADGKAYSSPGEVELIFQWPTSAKSVPPKYLEFKNTCRAEVPAIKFPEDKKKAEGTEPVAK